MAQRPVPPSDNNSILAWPLVRNVIPLRRTAIPVAAFWGFGDPLPDNVIPLRRRNMLTFHDDSQPDPAA